MSQAGSAQEEFCAAVQVLIAIYVVFMVVVVLTITLLPADWRL